MNTLPIHTFHIPVMGLAYTIDSPLKVARFGISSVISLLEDTLIEKMRSYYYSQTKEEYKPINTNDPDFRAKRITDYLNLVNKIVHEQIEKLKASTFETGSDIVQYFEMLPDNSKLKALYNMMIGIKDVKQKDVIQQQLRQQIVPGSIDVNIMTKIDKNNYDEQGNLIEDGSDAIVALRGYANSNLTGSSVVFSAGMNPRLYNYIANFEQFTTLNDGTFDKKVVIKVSDFRSAMIQGRYLARKGVWVSEFRIESGLNCGGHAFASDGYLLGPILEEFKTKRNELIDELFTTYCLALVAKKIEIPKQSPELRITVQGGIGNAKEDTFLQEYYNVDGTGWGTPFLLVPEATTVDEATLKLLMNSKVGDVILSNNSPLGVKFSYLKGSSREIEKNERINSGKPGGTCTEQVFPINTEFSGKPVCTASHSYQMRKLEQLKSLNLSDAEFEKQSKAAFTKECLCVGLSNAALIKHNIEPIKGNSLSVTVCPGPNIAYFSKTATLKEMTDHIYGRTNLLNHTYRPNLFVSELNIYIDYLKDKYQEALPIADNKMIKYYQEFCNNLLNGISYYEELTTKMTNFSDLEKEQMKIELLKAEKEVLQFKETITPIAVGVN